jgi:aspartate kinase
VIIVQKYGGSSLATTEHIRRVAARIAETVETGFRVCVVVSAMGKTTDELLARAQSITESPPRRELDMLLTCGERASMALLSMAVVELGLDAISFTGSQCGILTNDRHWGARIVEVRPFRVADELERGKVVIVAGFQGVSYKREITTLGRGGSDTTAVALAAALGAEYCEICSDVDGVYTADPRVVEASRLLESIGHDEMLELAAHGARVLHPEAVEFARRAGIALWARATDGSGGGTRIGAPDLASAASVGITGQRRLRRIAVDNPSAAAAFATLAGAQVPTLDGFVGAQTELVVDESETPDWPRVEAALRGAVESLAVTEIAAASVIGGAVGNQPDAVSAALEAAAEAGVEVLGVRATPLRITLLCDRGDLDALQTALHERFVR